MSDLDGLVPWLHAQLDAREKCARAAAEAVEGGDWSPRDDGGVVARGPRGITVALGPEGFMNAAVEDHIAAHDPARVLRAIEAKRRILAWHEEHERLDRETFNAEGGHARSLVSLRAAYFDAVRALATEYANRPGYREEWRP